MSIEKLCLNCGAKLHKDDIFCLECETPVLTDDDITLMPNAAATRVLNELEYSDSLYDDSIPPVDDVPSVDSATPADIAPAVADPSSDTILYIEDTEEIEKAEITKKVRMSVPQRIVQSRRAATQKHSIPKNEKKQPEKKSNRNAIITIFVLLLIVALGVGLFFLLQPARERQEGSDISTPAADMEGTDTDEDSTPVVFAENTEPSNPQPAPPPAQQDADDETEVTSIVLYKEGRAQTEFHTMLNEVITMRAQILPEGSTAAITWTSSDPDVLEVISFGPNGSEASVVGKIPGVADIIVSTDNFEMSYIVFVDDFPLHVQLENAIKNKNEPLWLIITWTSGQHNGEETVFEWDEENQEWLMEGAYNRSDPEPVFGETNNAFTIGFHDMPRVFYFFSDGSGHYRNPDGTDDEDFVWIFKTTLIEPEG